MEVAKSDAPAKIDASKKIDASHVHINAASTIQRYFRRSYARRKRLVFVNTADLQPVYQRRLEVLLNEPEIRDVRWYRRVLSVLHDRKKLSVRNIEWLCTNHSKCPGKDKARVSYLHRDYKTGAVRQFDLHEEYTATLASLGKRFFDAFRRGGNLFTVRTQDGQESWNTTVAQLQFTLWAHRHGVIDYCIRNRDAIRQTIRDALSRRRRREQCGKRKRSPLSEGGKRACAVFRGGNLVFDDCFSDNDDPDAATAASET